jgi:acyl carrier protein
MKKTEAVIRDVLSATNDRSSDADASADLYAEIGLASIQAITLLADLEERFSIHIPDDDFIEARSISKLTAIVDALLEQSANA